MATNLILEAVKTALKEGEATVNLKEASALTGSGSGIGGRVIYDDAFASLRQNNPIRNAGARVINTIGSDEAFIVKTGNVTNIQNGSFNPWGYAINDNNADGSTGLSSAVWQISVKSINASVPVRTAVMDDINNIDSAIIGDIALEFAQQEALSMMFNNDATGSATVNYGATSGLRGLNYYTGSTSAAAFGTSGYALTNGRHTMLQVTQASAGAVVYDDLANLMAALPPQYLFKETTCWMMHPTTIGALRKLKASTTTNNFIEVGDDDGGAVMYIFGHCVIPNPYMSVAGSGNYSVYLANWERFVTIADNELMSLKRFDQTQPGFVTLFAEKRVCSTILDVFAGVRLIG